MEILVMFHTTNMIKIPQEAKKWSQVNSSDLFGTIKQSRNLDFDYEGYLTLAKRTRCIFDTTVDSDYDRPVSIVYYQGTPEYWVFTRTSHFRVNATTLAVTEAVDGNLPNGDTNGARNDGVIWQGRLYATNSNSLRYFNGTSWSTDAYTLTSHGPLCVHEKLNALAIGQGNTVLLLDTSHSLLQTLVLPTELYVTSICFDGNYLICATRHLQNGDARIIQWDGDLAVPNDAYSTGSHRVGSVKAYKGTHVIVDGSGRLRHFNGSSYVDLGALPVFYKGKMWDYDGNITVGKILHRGMTVNGDNIYLNVSPRILYPNDSNDTINKVFENYFEGGIWCYSPKVGLHHRYSMTGALRTTDTIPTSDVNTSTNVITVTDAPPTGTPIIYDNGGGTTISGLIDRRKYYCIYLSSTTLKLATTYANAIAGTPISLGSTGNNAQYLIFITNRDIGGSNLGGYGATGNYIEGNGAVLTVPNRNTAENTDIAQVIFSGRMGGNSVSSTKYILACATFGQENRGFFITPKLQPTGLSDVWQNISIKYKNVKTVDDKILVKWRCVERLDTLTGIDQALTMTATWVNSTRFTSTADLSAAKVGDEVSFHSGSGSGYMAHIVSISESAGTYTVNIDETIQNITASETVGFVIENWNKIGSITTSDNDYYTNDNGDRYSGEGGFKSFNIGKNAKWIEIKVELRGEDVKIEELLVNNVPFKRFIA